MLVLVGFNLPTTMGITQWSESKFNDDYTTAIVYKQNSKVVYHVSLFDNRQTVEIKINDKTLLSFTDIMLDNNNLGTLL